MSEHDESLEIGLAAGLDIPTAMVISECEDEQPRKPKGCFMVVAAIVAVLAALVAAILWY